MPETLESTPMARALLGEREALAETGLPFTHFYGCFSTSWLGAKPHYADPAVGTSDGYMVWTYLPSGDPSWVADCPTYAEANALAEALSAPTLWEVHHV